MHLFVKERKGSKGMDQVGGRFALGGLVIKVLFHYGILSMETTNKFFGVCACQWDPTHFRESYSTYVIERPFSFISHWSSTIWSALLRKKFSNPRNGLEFQCMGLGQPLRHRQALAPLISCHPFLLVTRMGLQALKLPLPSVWVFSFAFRIFKCWLIVIEQTAHSLGVSTSVSALEISDLPPVSVPAAGPNLVQHV